MRTPGMPATLLALLFIFQAKPQNAKASPLATNSPVLGADIDDATEYLMERGCDGTVCGWYGNVCCTGGSVCYTDSNDQAQCSSTAAAVATTTGGDWEYYTSVYTETDLVTRTSVWSSYVGAATTTSSGAVVTASCDTSAGESSCGAICCASDQYCYTSGQCNQGSGLSASYASSWSQYFTTSTYSAPLRPTSGASTATSTASATTTVPFSTPVSTAGGSLGITTSSTSRGLSGGAIAGIVIGVLAGIILLALLCFCCIARELFGTILSIFGLGRRRRSTREREEVIVERRSRYGSAAGASAARRDTHSGWVGSGGRPTRVTERTEKKNSGLGGIGAVGAGLAGLAVILGLKRRADARRSEKDDATVTTSDYSYTDESYTGTESEYKFRSIFGVH